MPIFLHKNIEPDGEVGLWDITESETFFRKELILTSKEKSLMQNVALKRKKEWMAGRLLLHKMSGRKQRAIAQKDEHGKPHLYCSKYDISLSHSGRFAAVIAAPYLVGVDIQKIVPKMKRIERKFMTDRELATLSQDDYLEHLHVYWGAKEALFKAYGKGEIEFRTDLLLDAFEYDTTLGKCRGYVRKKGVNLVFDVYYQLVENYMLVYVIEIK